MCKRGNASKEATELVLKSEVFGGIKNVYNIEGGYHAIQEQIDPNLP
jgi:rhodanese-related sulfurtransferase